MKIIHEKVYQTLDGYVRVKLYEDGSFDEFPIEEKEALVLLEQQKQSESLPESLHYEDEKYAFPIGYHEDGRKITEEEIENVRKMLYGDH